MFIPKIRSIQGFWRSATNVKAASPTPVSNAIASRFPDLPPIRRPAGFAGTHSQPSAEAKNMEALRHYMNLDNARSILANNAQRILSRDPAAPPSYLAWSPLPAVPAASSDKEFPQSCARPGQVTKPMQWKSSNYRVSKR